MAVRRRSVVAGVVVVLVAAAVGAALYVLARTPDPDASGDWPGQFLRCGTAVEDLPADTGPVRLALDDAPTTLAPGDAWTATATATVTSGDEAWVVGTDVSFVQGGVVVAVQDGPQVLQPSDALTTGPEVDPDGVRTDPVTPLSVQPLTCDEYLHGDEQHPLEPGTYDVVVTQTLGVQDATGTATVARASARTTLEVTTSASATSTPQASSPTPTPDRPAVLPPVDGPADTLFTCGQPVRLVATQLPDAAGLSLTADLPATSWAAGRITYTVTLGTQDGSRQLVNAPLGGTLALTDGSGDVVAFVGPRRVDVDLVEVGPDRSVVLAATGDAEGDATTVAVCQDDGTALSELENPTVELPDGTYTAWPFAEVLPKELTDASGQTTTPPADLLVVVAAPQAVTLRR
ncbi:hypothetical protein ACTHAM_001542 [Cellulomonas soli]|uniref:hypothetical protein n=1 Tax=Cellulomonas soli TaxID=931535 RepID=UPI003F834404